MSEMEYSKDLEKVCVIVRFKGFNVGGEFFTRELAYIGMFDLHPDSISFDLGKVYYSVGENTVAKRKIIDSTQNDHGLLMFKKWHEDAKCHTEIKYEFDKIYNRYATHEKSIVAFKGGVNESHFLSKWKIPALNLEQYKCPVVECLPYLLENKCSLHLSDKPHKQYMCPRIEVVAFRDWLMKKISSNKPFELPTVQYAFGVDSVSKSKETSKTTGNSENSKCVKISSRNATTSRSLGPSGSHAFVNPGNLRKSFSNTGNSIGNPGNSFGNTGNSFGNTGNSIANPGNSIGNTGNLFGNTGNSFGNTGNSFGNTGNSFGNTGNSFGITGPSFGNTGHLFKTPGTSFGYSGNSFGKSETSYGNSGSLFGNCNLCGTLGNSVGNCNSFGNSSNLFKTPNKSLVNTGNLLKTSSNSFGNPDNSFGISSTPNNSIGISRKTFDNSTAQSNSFGRSVIPFGNSGNTLETSHIQSNSSGTVSTTGIFGDSGNLIGTSLAQGTSFGFGNPGDAFKQSVIHPGNPFRTQVNSFGNNSFGGTSKTQANSFGNPGNSFGIPGNSFGIPGNSFENAGNSFGNPGISFGNPSISFGNPGSSFRTLTTQGHSATLANQGNYSHVPYNFGSRFQAPFNGTQPSLGSGNSAQAPFNASQPSHGFGNSVQAPVNGTQPLLGSGNSVKAPFNRTQTLLDSGNSTQAPFNGTQPSHGFGNSVQAPFKGTQPSLGSGNSVQAPLNGTQPILNSQPPVTHEKTTNIHQEVLELVRYPYGYHRLFKMPIINAPLEVEHLTHAEKKNVEDISIASLPKFKLQPVSQEKFQIDSSVDSNLIDIAFRPKKNTKKLVLKHLTVEKNETLSHLPILNRTSYYTIPKINELTEDCWVTNFIIGRKNCGKVCFIGDLNVSGLNLDEIVFLNHREISVYPRDETKPPEGYELNRPAVITLENIWPKDSEQISGLTYEKKLVKHTERMGAKFIRYAPDTGSWTFFVTHF